MSLFAVLSLTLLLAAHTISEDVSVQVTTKKGIVTGLSLDGSHQPTKIAFDAFRGIPYGSVKTRFQFAVPPDAWNTPKDASKDGLPCPQAGGVVYSEDCLFINVYTPPRASTGTIKYPVMVFIHGSGFSMYSSDSQKFGPDFFVQNGVILVTFNYRLGALGFLTLGSKEAPGNLGLHDSVLALQWVHDEISAFGGDPTQVTLFGQSAGSIMTLYHYLSNTSSDLFQRAIGQSGSAVSDWGLLSVDEASNRGRALAKNLGCDTTKNATVILNCLTSKDIKDIISNQSIPLPTNMQVRGSGLPFVPVLDNLQMSDRPFFNTSSLENLMPVAMKRAKPLITGFTTDEGILMFSEFAGGVYNNVEKNVGAFRISGPNEGKVIDLVRTRYFNNTPTLNKVEGIVRLYTDYMFAYPSAQVTKYFANITYGYVFAYDGSWPNFDGNVDFYSHYKMNGVSHSQDLIYLFYNNRTRQSLDTCDANSNNIKVKNQMISWWTNFAKTGVPSNTWKTVDKSGYMIIDSTLSTFMNTTVFESQYYQFWSNIKSLTSAAAVNLTSLTLLLTIFTAIKSVC